MTNTNGSAAGFRQVWVPSSPAEALAPRLLLGGWSNLVSGCAGSADGSDSPSSDYSVYADVAFADGTPRTAALRPAPNYQY